MAVFAFVRQRAQGAEEKCADVDAAWRHEDAQKTDAGGEATRRGEGGQVPDGQTCPLSRSAGGGDDGAGESGHRRSEP